jgi:hypothetical protein
MKLLHACGVPLWISFYMSRLGHKIETVSAELHSQFQVVSSRKLASSRPLSIYLVQLFLFSDFNAVRICDATEDWLQINHSILNRNSLILLGWTKKNVLLPAVLVIVFNKSVFVRQAVSYVCHAEYGTEIRRIYALFQGTSWSFPLVSPRVCDKMPETLLFDDCVQKSLSSHRN